MLCKDKKEWYDVSLIIEICLCTPCFIARLDQFFSQLKLVKTDQHTALGSKILSVILRIKLWQNLLTTFHDQYAEKILTYWYNQKGSREKERNTKIPQKNLVTHSVLRISRWTLMMIVRLTMIRMTSVQMKTMHSFFIMLSQFYYDDHL